MLCVLSSISSLFIIIIMVLFIFVIMLLNLSALPRLEEIDWPMIAGFGLGVVVLSQLLFVIASGFDLPMEAMGASAETGSARTLGIELYTRYALHIEVAAVLLLAATVGAVMLAQKRFE